MPVSLQVSPNHKYEDGLAHQINLLVQSGETDIKRIARTVHIGQAKATGICIRNNIALPLPEKFVAKYGIDTINAIKTELRAGTSRKEIQNKFHIYWAIIYSVILAEPDLQSMNASVIQKKLAEKHLPILKSFMKKNPNGNRTLLQKLHYRTYIYLNNRYKSVLDSILPCVPHSNRRFSFPPKPKAIWAIEDATSIKKAESIRCTQINSEKQVWLSGSFIYQLLELEIAIVQSDFHYLRSGLAIT